MLGGVLSGLLDWRWVFLVNVPICLAAAAAAPRVLGEWRDPAPAKPDVAGAVLATAGVAALLLALTALGPRGLALGALGVALLAALARVEARAQDPLLDRAVLRRPDVAGPNAVAAVLTATTSGAMILCVLHAQDVLGLHPIAAGLLFAPFNLAVIAGSLAGPRIPERGAMAGGLAAVAAGALALMAIGPETPAVPSLLGGFAVMGAGLGVASVASTARGTAALAAEHQGLASGLLATSAQLGTALGLAIVVPIAAARADGLGGGAAAQVSGYELGFAIAAAVAGAAALRTATTRWSLPARPSTRRRQR